MNVPMQRPQETLSPRADSIEQMSLNEAVKAFLSLIRRHWRLIGSGLLAGIALGVVVLEALPKKYMATASVFVDFLHPAGTTAQLAPSTFGLIDPAAIQSQMDILRSERVAKDALQRLNLFKTPEALLHPFPAVAALRWLGQEIGLLSPPTDYEIRRNLIDTAMYRTTVQRAGKDQGTDQGNDQGTFVIEVEFSERDPALAARMANAIVDSYMTDQLEARFASAKVANDWFTERLQTMRKSVADAEAASQKYKADNNITKVSGTRSLSLDAEQNLAQIEESLTNARTALTDSRSRLETLSRIITSGDSQAAVSDALASPSIQQLRTRYSELTEREVDLRQRGMPPDHNTIVQIHANIAETQRLIMEEFERLRNSTQNEVDSAENRISQLERHSVHAAEALKMIKAKELRADELDREAASVRALYETFMNQFQITTQAQSYPVSEARIVTVAEPPVKQSRKAWQFLLVGGLFGTLVSGGAAWLRENAGNVKTGPELEAVIGAPFLGMLPYIEPRSLAKAPIKRSHQADSLLSYVITHPTSAYAETIRNCKASLMLHADRPAHCVLGVLSSLQREGKSTFAANFALHLASNGYRTVLVDADTRNPELSGVFLKGESVGLVQVLTGKIKVDSALQFEADGFAFLPAGVQEAVTNPDELLLSQALDQLLAHLRQEFTYVIVDLPPMAPLVDAGIIARQLDSFVYIARWNTTTADQIRRSLKKSHLTGDKLIGGVINCVPANEVEDPPYSYRGLRSTKKSEAIRFG